jgi:hypothetical protein
VNLTEIFVQRTNTSHPEVINDNLRTGVYWTLSQASCAPGTFSVTLTLPYVNGSVTGDEKLCRWTGTGWACGQAGDYTYGATTVTRANVNQFSDWTVGDNVGPNVVTLRAFGIESKAALGLMGMLIGAAIVFVVWRKRT